MSASDMVTEILKKHGEWAETPTLVRLIKKEREVSPRQAYRDIKKAWGEEKIRKVKLPDGDVLYGLKNWPFPSVSMEKQPETLTFKDAFKYRYFKNMAAIASEKIDGDPFRAYVYMRHLIKMLPESYKQKLMPLVAECERELAKVDDAHLFLLMDNYQKMRWKQKRARPLVELLIDKVSTLLHSD